MRQVQPVQSFAIEAKTNETMEVRKGRPYIFSYIFKQYNRCIQAMTYTSMIYINMTYVYENRP